MCSEPLENKESFTIAELFQYLLIDGLMCC
jgi:hypothetical protein